MRRGSVAPPGDDTAGPFGDAITLDGGPEIPTAYGAATNQMPLTPWPFVSPALVSALK